MEKRSGYIKSLRILFWTLLLLAGLGAVGWKILTHQEGQTAPPNIAEIQAEKGLPVTLYQVEEGPWELWKRYYGTVRSATVQQVTSFVREYITDVRIDVGQRVKPGEVLISLSRETQAVDLGSRKKDYEDSKRNYERNKKLFASGGISQATLEKAELEMQMKRDLLREVETRLARTNVVARIGGTVIYRDAEIGEMAEPGRELLRIADLENLELEVLLPALEIRRIRPGTPVRMHQQRVIHRGKVKRINPEADQGSGLYRCIVSLEKGTPLFPGTSVEADFLVDRREHVVSVPYETVRRESGKSFVFVASGDRVEQRNIEIGEGSGGFLEVTARLYSGDLIVKEGVESVFDHARIYIQTAREAVAEPRLSDDLRE